MINTRKRDDRKQIVKTIKQAAAIYKAELVGKTFLYVFDNRYIEVIFKAENFKHLTGVDSIIPAKRFYRLAVHNQLMEAQISFSARHPFSLCQRKLKHIADIARFASAESFMLEEISTDSFSYKFGTTDLSFTLCMGEDLDSEGNKRAIAMLFNLYEMRIVLIKATPYSRFHTSCQSKTMRNSIRTYCSLRERFLRLKCLNVLAHSFQKNCSRHYIAKLTALQFKGCRFCCSPRPFITAKK